MSADGKQEMDILDVGVVTTPGDNQHFVNELLSNMATVLGSLCCDSNHISSLYQKYKSIVKIGKCFRIHKVDVLNYLSYKCTKSTVYYCKFYCNIINISLYIYKKILNCIFTNDMIIKHEDVD